MIHLTPEQRVFVTERHLATLSTLRANGTVHVVPVAFTWDHERGVARVTTNRSSVKARNARGHGDTPARGSICQVEGGRWITLEGELRVLDDGESVRDAERRYAVRYRELEENPERIVLELAVDRVMSSAYMSRG
ncbi:pyridoxamine 5'-phosphate oxidase family protein [Populibacterium corticicola]|uniref:Pyridoxamine 5'-phosphate oxidase family protein n=1 Tax=Populibacterium corticicola TaxID=1812826 RepID=A0ABW5XFH1_9MICO